ncbi:MAG: DUF2325 domain-containing protein [Desulfamplus sp.]|nr:DUF2325 domain-containing protein [Desulfamplus sp.]
MNYNQPFKSLTSISGNKEAFMQSLTRILPDFNKGKKAETGNDANKPNLNSEKKPESNITQKEIESEKKKSADSFRLKFWEIDELFACPIAGMCITLEEQKRLLKQVGISIKNQTLFDIHEVLVSSSSKENTLSSKIDRFLVRKFSHQSKIFDGMTQDELLKEWRVSFKAGEYTGIFWYITSRRDLSKESAREIFGDIHMSMHNNSLERAAMTRKILLLQEQKNKAEEKRVEAAKDRKSLQKEVNDQKSKIKELEARLIASEKEKSMLKSKIEQYELENGENLLSEIKDLRKQNVVLKDKQIELSQKKVEFEQKAIKLESENKMLSCELLRKNSFEADLQKEFLEIMTQIKNNSCDRSCPSFDLCKKRVLIVGGMSKMESLYRQIVEQNGGFFEYHDGYVKGGIDKLECCFKRADIVLCPVNCNSHAACSLVKQLGKKHNKPVQMLAGAGLNAIFNGIKLRYSFDGSDIQSNFDDGRAYSSVRGSKSI